MKYIVAKKARIDAMLSVFNTQKRRPF